MNRTSPIAGSWYNGDSNQLSSQIENLFLDTQFGPGIKLSEIQPIKDPKQLVGIISPHAGYVYSGSIAAWGFKSLKENYPVLDTCIILGPNHRGNGPGISVYPGGKWEYPNCDLSIDNEIVDFIRKLAIEEGLSFLEFETLAHEKEHSIDIQGPFIGELYGNTVKIVPICIRDQNLENAEILSKLLMKVYANFENKKIAIIASSDLSHEEDYQKLLENDELITEAIIDGDPTKTDEIRLNRRVTMCGYGPVLTLMKLTNKLGIAKFGKNKYANSRQIKPGGSYTVGYLSVNCYII